VTTLLVQAAGRQRLGRLMGMATLPLVVVPVFGPVVGGLILDNLSWRWIFYVNVPICLTAIYLAWRTVPATTPEKSRHGFDLLGFALLSPALALVIYGLSRASGSGGFASWPTLVPLAVGLVLIGAFVGHALRQPEGALLNLKVFKVRSYSAAVSVFFLAGLSLYGPLLLLALYYQEVQGKSALVAGLLLAPQGLGSLVPRTMAGKLTDRIGPRVVVLSGLVLTALGTVAFTQAGPSTNEWLLAVSLLVRGAGLAAATIAVMAGAFQGVRPNDVPDASTITRIVQQVGGSFGTAVLAVVLASGLAGHEATAAARAPAFNTAFYWAIGFTVLALLPAFFLPGVIRKKKSA
jgi:EmrB/QacA subfamily drug resistance transporter